MKRTLLPAVAALLAVTLGATGIASPALARGPDKDHKIVLDLDDGMSRGVGSASQAVYGPYRIVFTSGYCLDVPWANAYVGAQLWQQGCWGGSGNHAQLWNFIWTGYHYQVQSVLNPSLCLNDWEGNHAAYDTVRLYYCDNNNPDSAWRLVGLGSYTYRLADVTSGSQCLNMAGAVREGKSILWWCRNENNMNFRLAYP